MATGGPRYSGLIAEREIAITNINHVTTTWSDADQNWTEALVETRMGILDGYWQRFQTAQQKLATEYSDIDAVVENMGESEATAIILYSETKAFLLQQKKNIAASATPLQRIPRASEIKLSKFSGKYTEWAAWRSEFQAKVTTINQQYEYKYMWTNKCSNTGFRHQIGTSREDRTAHECAREGSSDLCWTS